MVSRGPNKGHYWIGRSASLRRSEMAMFKAVLCKLNIRHEWHVNHAEDGSVYRRCQRCGKDDDERAVGGGNFSHWAGG